MRRASTIWLSAALAAVVGLVAAPAPEADARKVRVFAVGPKLDIAWMESRSTYRDKMFALADRRLRGGSASLTQDGADDFASHLLGPEDRSRADETARDLVTWPEDVGLFAALTGPRAAPARGSGSLEGSILTLATIYGSQNAYYASRFPDAAARGLPVRLTFISLTDTYARVAVETFAEMADRYDVYLEAGVNMAQDWQVVCDDRERFNAASPPRLPGGVLCQEQNADKVDQLGDPFEPDRDYAYEAVTSKVSNMALLFDPNGRLVFKQPKAYVTPTELPGQLDLVPADPSDVRAVRTPVGTLGFVTSKDAWMPDVQAKLDQRRVDLLVQPEFFVNDLVKPEGMWSPDTLRASGYNDVLRLPSVETLVLPELVGNIFNFSADAQQHIAVKPRTGRGESRALIGGFGARGLVDVMPWVVDDPIRAGEPVAERRRRLGEAGLALAPGSGVACPDPARPGPCENGHVEGVLFRDVEVPRRPRYKRFRDRPRRTRFSAARPVARSSNPQRNAAISRYGRHAVLAFEERRGGRDQVLLARSSDGGRTWSRPVRPTGRPPGSTDEWWPAVAIDSGRRVTVAWVDRSTGRERVYLSRSTDGGRRFGAPRPVDGSPPAGVLQWRPALAPGRGDLVHLAFVDERERSADDAIPQAHLYYARVRAGRVEKPRRLDTGEPAALAQKLDNSWAPRISARGDRVLVTWIDFLNYDWDVFSRESTNAGETFADQRAVNDTPEDDRSTADEEQDEALNDAPEPALGARTPFVAWTDWRKRDSTGPRAHPGYDVYVATPGGKNRQVDHRGAAQLSTFAPSICATSSDEALVAYQDAGNGQNDVQAVRLRGGRRTGPVWRVDDAGRRGGNAWRPRLGCWGDAVAAVWEDERDGPPQVYAATSSMRRLR